jgi:predicted nucleic acid-binding protein
VPFVVDASITISWAMNDESDPRAEMALKRAETDRPMVPAIWWYEAGNMLLVNERRGRITRHEAEAFLGFFEQFNAVSFAVPDNGAVMDLARKHRLTVYDAAYLALAVQQRVPLATLDRALEAAARAEGVVLVA